MKRSKKIILALLVSLFAITGCGDKNKLSPSEAMTKAANNMKELKSFKMDANAIVSVEVEQDSTKVSTEISAKATATLDDANKKGKIEASVNMMGEEQKIEMYVDFSDKKTTVYMLQDDEWTKTTSEDFDLSSIKQTEDSANLDELFEKMNVKEAKSDSNNYNYEITLKDETINEMFESLGDKLEDVPFDVKSIAKDIKLMISIDKKTGNYSKMSMDLKDLLKKVLSEMSDEAGNITIKEAKFDITISENAGTVEIPKDALKAKEQ